MNDLLFEFLKESNAIEDVWDERSLLDAVKAWDYLVQFDELTIERILKCHDILMERHLRKEDRGVFRKYRVVVGTAEVAKATMIPNLIDRWLELSRLDLKDEKRWHVEFERIHPFVDGNGRTGRIILNWMRVKAGKPILVIKEKEKQEYYKWFRG